MKIAALVGVCALLLFVVYETGVYFFRGRESERRLRDLEAQVLETRSEYSKLQSEVDYYRNADNFEKELRARFNYRRPDEKMIIIVPTSSAPSASSSPSSTR